MYKWKNLEACLKAIDRMVHVYVITDPVEWKQLRERVEYVQNRQS